MSRSCRMSGMKVRLPIVRYRHGPFFTIVYWFPFLLEHDDNLRRVERQITPFVVEYGE